MESVARRIAARLDRGLLPFMGPAQIGAGHPEEPYRTAPGAVCPLCSRPMTEHRIARSGDATTPTYLTCPA